MTVPLPAQRGHVRANPNPPCASVTCPEPPHVGHVVADVPGFEADLLAGRRSTPPRISRSTVRPTLEDATPGDLSFALPYRYISDILEMLEALDSLCPGLYVRDTLLYGVEVKFYSSRPSLGADLQSEIPGLYAVGDGAGITRGLVQASASGIVAARSILSR